MLKIASKFAIDIIPSVIATIIGAYIVNHYIVSKPTDAPTAAVVSPATPKKADVANVPEPGVRAKGISEKSVIDKSNMDRATFERPVEKPADKAADKPAETASIPPENTRRHPTNSREKTAKASTEKASTEKASTEKTAPEKPVVPVVEPVVSAPTTAPAVEAAIAPDRDANDLARAAIERLRATPDSSRPSESSSVRLPEPPRVVMTAPAAPTAPAPSLQPLPPPILVSTPSAESAQPRQSSAGRDDPRRPTPPADIPDPRPLDLRADAVPDQPPPREHTNVAEDVFSAAKSMFHSVLPNNSTK